jgi:hypothetical protein
MSNVKLNRVSQLAGEQKLIDGTKQFLWQLQSIPVGSQMVTPPEIVKVLDDRIALVKAAIAAADARAAAVKAERDERKRTTPFVNSLKRIVGGMFSQVSRYVGCLRFEGSPGRETDRGQQVGRGREGGRDAQGAEHHGPQGAQERQGHGPERRRQGRRLGADDGRAAERQCGLDELDHTEGGRLARALGRRRRRRKKFPGSSASAIPRSDSRLSPESAGLSPPPSPSTPPTDPSPRARRTRQSPRCR